MTAPAFHLNEVAHAYERNFELLEAARDEYAKTVTGIMRQFHQRLEERVASLDWDVQIIPSLREDGFRSEVECRLTLDDRATGFCVIAKAATPQGGSAGCLLSAAYGWFDEKLAPVTRDRAFDKSGDFPEADRSTGFLGSRELTIADDKMDEAVDSLLDTLKRLSPFALEQFEEQDFTDQMIKILQRVLPGLNPPQQLATSWTTSKFGRWEGLHFIQTGLADKREIWVGYHAKDSRLMYGHYDMPGDSRFQQRLFSAVGASEVTPASPFLHGKLPAGVVLERDVLLGKSSDEIESLVCQIFKIFYDLLMESPLGSLRSTSGDSGPMTA